MHRLFLVDDIIHLLACELVGSDLKATAVSLACCSRAFEVPVLKVLWGTQVDLSCLFTACLPQGIWKEGDKTFVSQMAVLDSLSPLNHFFRKELRRIPTEAEWAVVKKYARNMRKLTVDGDKFLQLLKPSWRCYLVGQTKHSSLG